MFYSVVASRGGGERGGAEGSLKGLRKGNANRGRRPNKYRHLATGRYIARKRIRALLLFVFVSTAASILTSLRSPRCLGKACCEACPIRLISSGVGFSGGCKAGPTLKE